MNTLQKLILAFLVLATALMPATSLAAEDGWRPFTLDNGFIVIDVEIDGHPARAILDSGAASNMINSSFVTKHGQDFIKSGKITMRGVFGEREVQRYTNIPVKLFGMDMAFNDVAAGLSGGVELLIGGGLFQNIIVQIDYPKSRIRLLNKDSVDLKKQANVRMKRARGSQFPAVQVEANGKKVWLVFDTGNTGGLLVQRSFAIENDWLHDNTESTQNQIRGVVNAGSTESFSLNALKIGPYTLDNVLVHVPGENQNSNLDFGERNEPQTGSHIKHGVRSKGLLGYEVLKHFVVTIDYSSFRVNFYAPP